MKTFKKFISVLLSAIMLVSLLPILPAKAEQITSGSTGDCNWNFNKATGELIISGSGKMENYSNYHTYKPAPWYGYREEIKSLRIEHGVTRISSFAFFEAKEITEIKIPDSVQEIGKYAFAYCTKLKTANIPDGVVSISNVFPETALETIDIPKSVKKNEIRFLFVRKTFKGFTA